MASGLGGGSADAAAVILGIANEIAQSTSVAEMSALGAKIGADVPFCLYACAAANPSLGYTGTKAALAEGIGEVLTPLQDMGKAWVVLVKPDIEIKTSEIYALYDEYISQAGKAADDHRTPAASDNDLEEPCMRACPAVAETREALKNICREEGCGNAKVQLTGSGPTVFAFFDNDHFGQDSKSSAQKVYDRAKDVFKDCFVYLTETL